MKISRFQTLILLAMLPCLFECDAYGQKPPEDARRITVATIQSKGITLKEQYVCQIHSRRRIDVQALAEGVIGTVQVSEGQVVKRGDLLFKVRLPEGKDRTDAEKQANVISIKAYFDGEVGRLPRQEGSPVQKGDSLTTLSDSSEMWVYFKVPEARYLEYKAADLDRRMDDVKVELFLADGKKFDQPGKLGAIGTEFNPETGTIPFRADFPNPERLLRHGQTGTVLISRVQKDAIVIPQRATFGAQNKRYVYAVDKDDVAHRREIIIQNEVEDQFVVKTGVSAGDRIVVEGVRQVHDGDKVK
jgi:membrane fusion protein, multidrug efflux system